MTPLPWHHEIAATIALAFITSLLVRSMSGRLLLWLRIPLVLVAMWVFQAINSTLPPDWITNELAGIGYTYWWSCPWWVTQVAIYIALFVQGVSAGFKLSEEKK